MNKNLVDQEKEIKDLVRRAEKHPDKAGTTRREAFERLIDLTHSSHPSLKSYAAGNIRLFFKDFPDLEEDAINAVYDLCEDQDSKVRIDGYGAIVQVSREEKKWVKRNADVLVQLLQSDEPEEVVFVKKALLEHLDMDPRVSLGVLCDQIVPLQDHLEEEELRIRERLRSLVIIFLSGEAKSAITERYTSPEGTEAEDVLVTGLLAAITQLKDTEVEIVVKDLLLSLPCYQSYSARGDALLEMFLDKAKTLLLEPANEGVSLTSAEFYLSLADFLVVQKRISSPAMLLKFYCTSLTGKMVFQRFPQNLQITLVGWIAGTFEVCESESRRGGRGCTVESFTQLRIQILDASPDLVEILSNDMTRAPRTWEALKILLKPCIVGAQREKWPIPPQLLNTAHKIQAVFKGQSQDNSATRDVQNLIRLLIQLHDTTSTPTPTPTPPSRLPPPPASLPNKPESSTGSPLRPPKSKAGVPGHQRDLGPPRNNGQTHEAETATEALARISGTSSAKRHIPGDENMRSKRAKTNPTGKDGNSPSLLSRMTISETGIPPDPVRRRVNTPNQKRPSKSKSPEVDTPPVGGYSIKGAARTRQSEGSHVDPYVNPTLLDRLAQTKTR